MRRGCDAWLDGTRPVCVWRHVQCGWTSTIRVGFVFLVQPSPPSSIPQQHWGIADFDWPPALPALEGLVFAFLHSLPPSSREPETRSGEVPLPARSHHLWCCSEQPLRLRGASKEFRPWGREALRRRCSGSRRSTTTTRGAPAALTTGGRTASGGCRTRSSSMSG
jgi:hypothetical protein